VVGKDTFKGMCKEKEKKKSSTMRNKAQFMLVHYKLGNQGSGKHLGVVVGNSLGFNIL
jgi:hypothetical protein